VTLPPSNRLELTLRLRPEHLALLRRMGTIRAVARVETAQSRFRTAVLVHAPLDRAHRRMLALHGRDPQLLSEEPRRIPATLR
jgi:hypothetical protein